MRRYDVWESRILRQDVSGNTQGICKRAESLTGRALRIGASNVDATIAKILAGTPLAQRQYFSDALQKITGR